MSQSQRFSEAERDMGERERDSDGEGEGRDQPSIPEEQPVTDPTEGQKGIGQGKGGVKRD